MNDFLGEIKSTKANIRAINIGFVLHEHNGINGSSFLTVTV